MGLLDDAIKEHLELKRKHGAPEEEVQRQEEEALGPVRRDAAQQPESADAELVEAEGEELPAAEEEEGLTAAADEELLFEEEEAGEEPFAAGEEPATEAQPEPRIADPDATQEYDPFAAEEQLADEGAEPAVEDEEGEGGDVLEDTPDFLQETPEHDRLWFEQKPPRDFDFD
jgi:hypothetical protein